MSAQDISNLRACQMVQKYTVGPILLIDARPTLGVIYWSVRCLWCAVLQPTVLVQLEICPGRKKRTIVVCDSIDGQLSHNTSRLTSCRHATWYGLSVSNTDFGLF